MAERPGLTTAGAMVGAYPMLSARMGALGKVAPSDKLSEGGVALEAGVGVCAPALGGIAAEAWVGSSDSASFACAGTCVFGSGAWTGAALGSGAVLGGGAGTGTWEGGRLELEGACAVESC